MFVFKTLRNKPFLVAIISCNDPEMEYRRHLRRIIIMMLPRSLFVGDDECDNNFLISYLAFFNRTLREKILTVKIVCVLSWMKVLGAYRVET